MCGLCILCVYVRARVCLGGSQFEAARVNSHHRLDGPDAVHEYVLNCLQHLGRGIRTAAGLQEPLDLRHEPLAALGFIVALCGLRGCAYVA